VHEVAEIFDPLDFHRFRPPRSPEDLANTDPEHVLSLADAYLMLGALDGAAGVMHWGLSLYPK
jgi:hypothetical protein